MSKNFKFLITGKVGILGGVEGVLDVEADEIYECENAHHEKIAKQWVIDGIVEPIEDKAAKAIAAKAAKEEKAKAAKEEKAAAKAAKETEAEEVEEAAPEAPAEEAKEVADDSVE